MSSTNTATTTTNDSSSTQTTTSITTTTWLDALQAPLHPCSVESIPEPVTLAKGTQVWPVVLSCYELQGSSSTTTTTTTEPIRVGQADLYLIPVPDDTTNATATTTATSQTCNNSVSTESLPPPKPGFGPCSATLFHPSHSSGILDGKWCRMPSFSTMKNESNSWSLATAHSSGEIRLTCLEILRYNDDDDDDDYEKEKGEEKEEENDNFFRQPQKKTNRNSFYQTRSLGQSDPLVELANLSASSPPLCLSVNWKNDLLTSMHNKNNTANSIVSTYSNGHVAIHGVIWSSASGDHTAANNNNNDDEDENDQGSTSTASAQVILQHGPWLAHTIHKTPAEVWTACFLSPQHGDEGDVDDHDSHSLVATGGDDGYLCVWDLRCPTTPQGQRPAQRWQPGTAGVTCLIPPHPLQQHSHQHQHQLLCGTYDEIVSIWDIRHVRQPLLQTEPLGGGIWRMKWHPYDHNRLLVAAMHGGCHVLQFHQGMASQIDNKKDITHVSDDGPFTTAADAKEKPYRIVKSFTAHESMAYGADWLVYPPHRPTSALLSRSDAMDSAGSAATATQACFVEAAVSCSFYDRAVYLWDTRSIG